MGMLSPIFQVQWVTYQTFSLVTNCSTVSNGEIGFCSCNPCSENEGDCESDDECQDGHFCGYNNCPVSIGFDSDVDCCYKPTELMSPNYPNSYPNNAEETWLLTAPTGSIIILQFHSFHVRHIVECINITKYEFIYFCSTDSNTLYI